MAESVKRRRSYDASRRREQARENRRHVLEAARDLFVARGYAGTSLAAVAAAAGVSVQTVYAVFGTKPGLLKQVIDVAIVGDDAPVPLSDREDSRRIDTEPDARRALTLYAAQVRRVSERVQDVLLLVYDGAACDPAVAELAEEFDRQRLVGMTGFADSLMRKQGLVPGISREEVRDVLWTFNSPQLYDVLVRRRGWTLDRYETWVARAWTRLLCQD